MSKSLQWNYKLLENCLNPSNGIINPQEGYLNPSSRFINPYEGNLNPSSGM